MTTSRLRAADHPDLSDELTHFTGRARQETSVEPWIRQMTPAQRLNSILRDGLLLPAVTYSGGQPAACFTESTQAGLKYLIRSQGFDSWGLVVDRQWVYDQGGAPVWYYRDDDRAEIDGLSDRLRTWTVRLSADPARPSDWLHEREWRIPRPAGPIQLNPNAIKAIIVGDVDWTPDPIDLPAGADQSDFLGDGHGHRFPMPPPCWAGKPRWLWQADKGFVTLPAA